MEWAIEAANLAPRNSHHASSSPRPVLDRRDASNQSHPTSTMPRILLALLPAAALWIFASSCRDTGDAGVAKDAQPPTPASSNLPNFVVIVADDMGWHDASPYGHPSIQTPNMQRLADEGMRFEHAFVTTSSCSPSRASILTGRYPHNTGAEQLHWPLPEDQVTFVDLLREAGYWTLSAGKWHLGEDARRRFDQVIEGGGERTANAAHDSTTVAVREDEHMPGGGAASGAGAWVSTLRERPRDRPFCAWLSSFDPHRGYEEGIIPEPHDPDEVVVPPYLPDTPETRADLALYYDEITRLDHYVGAVLDELDRQQVADHTLVLFISDNGLPFPRAKTTLYDSGIRTPWITRFPGRVEAGTVASGLVSTIDIAPTILELADIEPATSFMGKSIVPMLDDPDAEVREYVFAEKNWHDYDDRVRAVRDARYKYLRNFYTDVPNAPPADAVRGGTFRAMLTLRDRDALAPEHRVVFDTPRPVEELYVISEDAHELQDVANDPAHAAALERLRGVLATWQEETHDEAPAQRTPDEYDRTTGEALPTRSFQRKPPSGPGT